MSFLIDKREMLLHNITLCSNLYLALPLLYMQDSTILFFRKEQQSELNDNIIKSD